VNEDVIVLIGWPPARKSNSPYLWEPYLNWLDPLGYGHQARHLPRMLRLAVDASPAIAPGAACAASAMPACWPKSGEIPFQSRRA